jgi:SAM-dependent methyltransferase
MHNRVKSFCLQVKDLFPDAFKNKNVLDCGSLDINGSNRYLFEGCRYHGIDIVQGPNVDTVTRVHDFLPGELEVFDTIISTAMLEHDEHWDRSMHRMTELLKPGGIMIITAAGYNRPEHGTSDHSPKDSPLTHGYYNNLTPEYFEVPHLRW